MCQYCIHKVNPHDLEIYQIDAPLMTWREIVAEIKKRKDENMKQFGHIYGEYYFLMGHTPESAKFSFWLLFQERKMVK